MKYSPISLNPEHIHEPSASPIHMLIPNKMHSYRTAIQHDNEKLLKYVEQLQKQLSERKYNNLKLGEQLKKATKKRDSWHKCFQESNEEYLKKVDELKSLESELHSLQRPLRLNRSKQYIRVSDKKGQKMSTETNVQRKGDERWIGNAVQLNGLRINSLAQQQHKPKRRQALSLTNLHKYKYESVS